MVGIGAVSCLALLTPISPSFLSSKSPETELPTVDVDNYQAVVRFNGQFPLPAWQDAHIDYTLTPSKEIFYLRVPRYSTHPMYGLIVYIDPSDQITQPPMGWDTVLDKRQLIFIAPQNAGNLTERSRRFGLAVMAAMKVMQHYPIDPHRVYVGGMSGGARTAGKLGFYQSDVFRGTLQSGGADFYHAIPPNLALSFIDSNGNPYGVFDATTAEVKRAHTVRFTFMTGSNDFRRGNVLDIYYGGYAKEGFQAKLFDTTGKDHSPADPETFAEALDFIEDAHAPSSGLTIPAVP